MAGTVPAILSVLPTRGLVDEKFKVVVKNLPPGLPVTLHSLHHSNDKDYWEAYGHYVSDNRGTVMVSDDASVGGTYTGKEPMGLLWSMRPVPGSRTGLRLRKMDVRTPMVVSISVYRGHVVEHFREQPPMASVVTERWYMAPGIQRIDIKERGVRGTLFIPPGPGPFPGVLDMWGLGGGLVEYRSALLASHGFVSMALEYLSPDELRTLDVELKYFETAFNIIQEHPLVVKDRVGLFGLSFGSSVTLNMAAYSTFISPRCCVCVSGSHVYPVHKPIFEVFQKMQTYAYKQRLDEQNRVIQRDMILPIPTDPSEKVEVGRIKCPLLLVNGDDDQNWATVESAEDIAKMMRAAGNEHLLTSLTYPNAGHLIEPPYTPHIRASNFIVHAGHKAVMLWGGKTQPHADAQEDAWEKTLAFLKQHLYLSPSCERDDFNVKYAHPSDLLYFFFKATVAYEHCNLLRISHTSFRTWIRLSSTMAGTVPAILSVLPTRGLVDEKFKVVVKNLPPGLPVTLHSLHYSEDKDYWEAYGHYVSDNRGTVMVSDDASVGGTYTGKEPMGLLWSMRPVPGSRTGLRLRKMDVCTPMVVSISVYRGHVVEHFREQPPMASVVTERWYMAPGIQRIDVNERGVRGTLFIPPGPGPFPGVLDMWGGGGGLVEYRSALLASHGFVSMALEYLSPDEPRTLDVELNYFETAFNIIQEHPLVVKDRVGLFGLSFGSSVTLSMAAYSTFISPRCCVCVSGSHVHPVHKPLFEVFQKMQTYAYKQRLDEQNRVIWRDMILPIPADPSEKVEVGRIKCPLLLVNGDDDQNWATVESAEDIAKIMRAAGNEHLLTSLTYPNAGHLIEPPYTPHIRASNFIVRHTREKVVMLWGGQPKPHADAQEDSWEKILMFLRQHLYPSPNTVPQAKL
ncbi:uncharacterized protein ACJ7VT_010761 [Polymixia lowei]